MTLVVMLLVTSILMPSCQKYEDGPGISLRTKKARLTHKETVWNTEWFDPEGLYDPEGNFSTESLTECENGYLTIDLNGDSISDAIEFRGQTLVAACKGGKSDLQFFKDGTCKTWFYSPIGTTIAKDWTGWDMEDIGSRVALVEFNGRWKFEDDKEIIHITWELLSSSSEWSDPDVVGDPPGKTWDWHCEIHKLTYKEVLLQFSWFTDSFLLELDQLPQP